MSDGILLGWLPLSFLVWAVHMVVYHGLGLGFEWCDQRDWLRGAKVRNVDRLHYSEILPRVLANQTFILLPAMLAVQWAGWAFTGPAELGPWGFVGGMIALAIGHDIVQYIFHRPLHRPGIARRLKHSIHHSTGASQAISACYMSGADFFFEIVLPYLLPLVLIGGGGSNIAFHILVASLGAAGGLYEHSGYDFAVPFRRTRFFAARPWLGGVIAGMINSPCAWRTSSPQQCELQRRFRQSGICDTLFGTRWDKVPGRAGARAGPIGA